MPSDPTLYLYTSLTAGSSHIITATSRIETILKANKIPFKAVDCATNDKARMLWQRRSKGKKIPGLVKFNDVIADLDQVEEWNEYGELEDQIEDQMDLFGDAISTAQAEAQAQAADATREAQRASLSSMGRTASETRHISINDPKGDARKQSEGNGNGNPARNLGGQEKSDANSPLNMAMRQAGAEAAAKAGQKKSDTAEVKAATTSTSKEVTDASVPAPVGTTPKLEMDVEEVSKVATGAKTPEVLASQGQKKTSLDKLGGSPEDEDSRKSNPEQILDQKRQAAVPQTSSSLSKSTSIDESHTVTASEDVDKEKDKSISPPSQSASVTEDKKRIGQVEKETAIIKEEGEDENEDDDAKEKEGEEPVKKAAKTSATDQGEEKVLKGSTPQEQEAGELEDAGKSVGD